MSVHNSKRLEWNAGNSVPLLTHLSSETDPGYIDKCIQIYSDAVKVNPRNKFAQFRLEICLQEKYCKRIDSSNLESSIIKGLIKFPTSLCLLCLLGNYYRDNGKYAKAVQNYKKAKRADIDKILISIRYNIGFCYSRMEQYNKALKYFRVHDLAQTHDNLLMLAYTYTSLQNFSEALAVYLKHQRIFEYSEDREIGLAALFVSTSRYISAALVLKKLIHVNPNHEVAKLLLAKVYVELDQFEEADRIYKSFPIPSLSILNERSFFYIHTRNVKELSKTVISLKKQFPESPSVQFFEVFLDVFKAKRRVSKQLLERFLNFNGVTRFHQMAYTFLATYFEQAGQLEISELFILKCRVDTYQSLSTTRSLFIYLLSISKQLGIEYLEERVKEIPLNSKEYALDLTTQVLNLYLLLIAEYIELNNFNRALELLELFPKTQSDFIESEKKAFLATCYDFTNRTQLALETLQKIPIKTILCYQLLINIHIRIGNREKASELCTEAAATYPNLKVLKNYRAKISEMPTKQEKRPFQQRTREPLEHREPLPAPRNNYIEEELKQASLLRKQQDASKHLLKLKEMDNAEIRKMTHELKSKVGASESILRSLPRVKPGPTSNKGLFTTSSKVEAVKTSSQFETPQILQPVPVSSQDVLINNLTYFIESASILTAITNLVQKNNFRNKSHLTPRVLLTYLRCFSNIIQTALKDLNLRTQLENRIGLKFFNEFASVINDKTILVDIYNMETISKLLIDSEFAKSILRMIADKQWPSHHTQTDIETFKFNPETVTDQKLIISINHEISILSKLFDENNPTEEGIAAFKQSLKLIIECVECFSNPSLRINLIEFLYLPSLNIILENKNFDLAFVNQVIKRLQNTPFQTDLDLSFIND